MGTPRPLSMLKELAPGTNMVELQRNEEIPYITPTSILTIFSRPWFHRVWIVQEVRLAKEAFIICGAFHVQFYKKTTIVALYAQSSRAFHTQGSLEDRLNHEISQVMARFFLDYVETMADI